jgi:mono/diheme cytochrome c family protein
MRSIAFAAGLTLVAGLMACEIQETPDNGVAVDEVEQAERRYDPVAFDTVMWLSQEAAIERGRDIYAWVCADCHGPDGHGDGTRVVDGERIQPPSFHREDWPYHEDPEALHRHVFVGNRLGMPHWGLRLMRPRDIVALEKYIRLELVGGP